MQKQPYYGPASSDSELAELCKAAIESCCAERTSFRDAEAYIGWYLQQHLLCYEAVHVDTPNPWLVSIEIDFGIRRFKYSAEAVCVAHLRTEDL